jgi:hypothetical protein
MSPARTMSLCDTASASAGACFSVGSKYWLNRVIGAERYRDGRSMRRRLSLLAILLAAVWAALAPVARAAGPEISIEDERLMLTDPAQAPAAVQAWKAVGIRTVRIHARWWVLAPGLHAKRMPRGFHGADPDDPRYDWSSLDNAVGLVRQAGMKVMLTITGPGPRWTSAIKSDHYRQWDPDPKAFGAFAHAVAERYGDVVDRYMIWNEPNQPGWLMPQSTCTRRGGCTLVAPHLYRDLVRAAVPQVHAADPHSQVLLGELAPIGRTPHMTTTPLKPLPFLRAMACVDDRYRPVRTGRCRHFKPARADAFGYHPHSKGLAPDAVNPDQQEAQFGDLPRLFQALDRLTRARRIVAPHRRFPVYLTEFGYQTNPPSSGGVTLQQQSRFLQEALYIASRFSRVKGLTFYQWVDEPTIYRPDGSAYATWQAGLFFVSGRAKPALSTFEAPFVIDVRPRGPAAIFWGQVRPSADRRAVVQMRRHGSRTFKTIARVRTDASGYWSKRIRLRPRASYRFLWTPARTLAGTQPEVEHSGVVTPGGRQRSPLYAGDAFGR